MAKGGGGVVSRMEMTFMMGGAWGILVSSTTRTFLLHCVVGRALRRAAAGKAVLKGIGSVRSYVTWNNAFPPLPGHRVRATTPEAIACGRVRFLSGRLPKKGGIIQRLDTPPGVGRPLQ